MGVCMPGLGGQGVERGEEEKRKQHVAGAD